MLKMGFESDIKWENIRCSWTGRINTAKMVILPKVLYRFSAMPVKILMTFSTELKKNILKFVESYKSHQTAKAILKK